jgi:hypothetical protein
MLMKIAFIGLALLRMQQLAGTPQADAPPAFTGQVQPKVQSADDAPLTKLIFRAEPAKGEVKGPEVAVDVKNGEFRSKDPLPPGRLSVLTVPSCIPLESVTLDIPGAEPALRAGEASILGTSSTNSGWNIDIGHDHWRIQWKSENQFNGTERTFGLTAGAPRLGLFAGMRDRMGGVNVGCPKTGEEPRKEVDKQ